MNYERSLTLTRSISRICGGNAIPAVKKITSDLESAPDAEATIICAIKAFNKGAPSEAVLCRVINGSSCPVNISADTLKAL